MSDRRQFLVTGVIRLKAVVVLMVVDAHEAVVPDHALNRLLITGALVRERRQERTLANSRWPGQQNVSSRRSVRARMERLEQRGVDDVYGGVTGEILRDLASRGVPQPRGDPCRGAPQARRPAAG